MSRFMVVTVDSNGETRMVLYVNRAAAEMAFRDHAAKAGQQVFLSEIIIRTEDD